MSCERFPDFQISRFQDLAAPWRNAGGQTRAGASTPPATESWNGHRVQAVSCGMAVIGFAVILTVSPGGAQATMRTNAWPVNVRRVGK